MNKKLIITSSILLWLILSYLTSKGLHWIVEHTGTNKVTPEDLIGVNVGSYLIFGIIVLVKTADILDKRTI